MSGVTIDIGKTPKNGLKTENDSNNYHYEDDSTRERVNVTLVEKLSGTPGYITLTYTPHNSETKITGIKESGLNKNEFNTNITDSKIVTVYYWSLDNTFSNPLLVQFGEGGSSVYYYITGNGNTWKTESGISGSTLKDKLDKQNCKRNKAHTVDISKKNDTSRDIKYNCPGCGSKPITVNKYGTDYATTDYSCYYHYLPSGSGYISGLQDKVTEQTGIKFTDTISIVYVYHYPSGSDGIPLLIYLLGSRWFERASIDSNNWTEVKKDKPGSIDEKGKILKLLRAKLLTVTIDLGQTNADNGVSGTYSDLPGGGEGKQIEVGRKDLGDGFVSFVHSVKGKTDFVAGDVKHNNDTLQGINKSFILQSVTAYYEGGFKLDNLLMVRLEKKNGQDKYVYYSREDGGSRWIPLYDQTGKIDGSSLTTKLYQSKNDLTKLYGIKSKLEVKREGSYQYTVGVSAGIIAGIIIGIICAVASIAFVVWWKKRFIAKLIINL
ncbi:hypothetical protein BEWA_003860 [Theileria equi strain WA]|uniref:Uncharacterized protein n=1 Tax=Theileria equi strain WA TaxID=1537102 RepID=L0B0G4_THEEQ|nr:hypothetical protein BEWA_003860 [Theileria equi strain WA]AFZ80978.1 hypothetical protein BEWA_003860 [Theileria equi strain WA]|eukprot:XP_004830644.1 hypothetical protein BEWA_003860 [Theileria equi strain WA]